MQNNKGIAKTFGICMNADVIIGPKYNLFEMLHYQDQKILTEKYPFYYHSDHLGSTTYLTDRNGNITQTLAYLPYGEDWVDITAFQPNYNNLFDTTMLGTYSFNGKEKDYESGFHYYGARYYASELGIWLSVDPMSDKYPSLSPYNYCADNPVKFIDPKGEEIWIINKRGTRVLYSVGMKTMEIDNYTAETINALNKLSSTKTIGLQIKQIAVNKTLKINIIENSNNTLSITKISEDRDNNMHISPNQDILFNPQLGIEDILTQEAMSPATALGHEFGHIINLISDSKEFNKRIKTKRNDIWDTEEEFYNIRMYEHGIAQEWKELQRNGHNTLDDNGKKRYQIIRTESSTSNKKSIE
jgi:RHS repeat-associated protein